MKIETRHDIHGCVIVENDVLRNVDTGEMRLAVKGSNESGATGLGAVNNIIGAEDWLDVFPDGVFEIVGNASVNGDA